MTTNNTITHFYLMRHASTQWNEEKRMQGHKDIPLSRKGRQDANRWGKKLNEFTFNRILTSPLIRALETANIINSHLKLPLHTDIRLKEQSLGLWEGKTVKSLQTEASQLLQKAGGNGWKFCPPKGESRLDVAVRIASVLICLGKKWKDEKILIVAHQGVVKFLIYHILKKPFVAGESDLLYSNFTHQLEYRDFELKIRQINFLSLSH